MQLPERLSNNVLPDYEWPSGYPILYLDIFGDTLCAECATKNSDTYTYFVHYEGPAEECAECGELVASAYGDPDVKEEN
jgi:hypothetical protein